MTFIPSFVEDFYPTPKQRIENPVNTLYNPGDIVKILIGPAKERIGKVVVERNGNYSDYEPYANAEGIGVSVVERENFVTELERAVQELSDKEALVHSVIRWFDTPDQLALIKKAR